MPEVSCKKNEVIETTPCGSSPPRTTLASIESLATPLVQEVVFLADYRCPKCQQRVAEIMTKMNGEARSIMISVLEKKITLTHTTYLDVDKLTGQQITSVQCNYPNSWSIFRLFRSSCS